MEGGVVLRWPAETEPYSLWCLHKLMWNSNGPARRDAALNHKRGGSVLGPWRGAAQMGVLKPCLSSFD